jgi:hypothetical protein
MMLRWSSCIENNNNRVLLLLLFQHICGRWFCGERRKDVPHARNELEMKLPTVYPKPCGVFEKEDLWERFLKSIQSLKYIPQQ